MAKKKTKAHKVMGEFKRGKLHSGSKKGPMVTKRKQAIAIAMSEGRKAGEIGCVVSPNMVGNPTLAHAMREE